jgi:hypothetical protein
MKNRFVKLATTLLVSGGMGLAGLGLASGTAQAVPVPAPLWHHHWCPGDNWAPEWGDNWDWQNCHDWDDGGGWGGGWHHHHHW